MRLRIGGFTLSWLFQQLYYWFSHKDIRSISKLHLKTFEQLVWPTTWRKNSRKVQWQAQYHCHYAFFCFVPLRQFRENLTKPFHFYLFRTCDSPGGAPSVISLAITPNQLWVSHQWADASEISLKYSMRKSSSKNGCTSLDLLKRWTQFKRGKMKRPCCMHFYWSFHVVLSFAFFWQVLY